MCIVDEKLSIGKAAGAAIQRRTINYYKSSEAKRLPETRVKSRNSQDVFNPHLNV